MRFQLFLAAVSGLIAVAAGAFAAHAVGDSEAGEWLRTGAQYQLPHAAAVFACFSVDHYSRSEAARRAAWMFLAGALLFSGSLYAMAATGVRALGMITPLGGLLLMAGWATLAWAGLQARDRPQA